MMGQEGRGKPQNRNSFSGNKNYQSGRNYQSRGNSQNKGNSKRDFYSQNNSESREAYAPYNFVPFADCVLQRYEDTDELPDYEKIDPQLKTGELVVSIEAKMPVYVSNGNEKNEDFFKGTNGNYQIPGSSVRGLIRENMQILGFGLIREGEDISDSQIYFRNVAGAKDSVSYNVKKYYDNALGVEQKRINSKPVSEPKKVLAGYLHNENGEFYITESRYIRVSRKNPKMAAFKDRQTGKIFTATTRRVGYTEGENIVKDIVPFEKKRPGMKEGVLLFTGNAIGKKENHLYVFEKENTENRKEIIAEEDILSYKEDWENRENSLKGGKYAPEFWRLPEPGESKPVFYIKECNGHTYFGMSLFLRIGYPHTIAEGLPAYHKQLNANEKVVLDYPYSILGFAKENKAYRSRVSVGDFNLESGKRCERIYRLLGAEPKPSWYAGYLNDKENYAKDHFTLRGYKQYWMREKVYEVPQNSGAKKGTEEKDSKMEKKVRPFDVGTKFKGVIRFRNLHEDELGLLLWTLLLETGCYQSIGMGAPNGLGRVQIQVEELREMSVSSLYSIKGFQAGLQERNENIEKYINAYKKFAKEKTTASNGAKRDIESLSEIKDFFFMRNISPLKEKKMKYMELSDYRNLNVSLKTVKQIREETKRE